jgi:hypothetical protein
MKVRKLAGMMLLVLLSVVLVSCTVGDEDEPEPTVEPTAPPVTTTISEPTEDADVSIPGTPAFEGVDDATPETAATPSLMADATPAEELMATPEGVTGATPAASPVATPVATPVVGMGATPEASPVGDDAGMVVPPAAEPTEAPRIIEMLGTIVLNGNENEAYVMTGEGCIGLGQHDGLHQGRQVVIRNETGTITSVTTLEPADDADRCAWQFVAAVPESEFYSVSIPMAFEQVFPRAQVAESNGEVTIELP